MKLGWFKGASVMVATALLSVVAAAQTGQGPLQIPNSVQFVGNQQPGIRKATAIVNGEIITETDVDQRMALIIASNRRHAAARGVAAAARPGASQPDRRNAPDPGGDAAGDHRRGPRGRRIFQPLLAQLQPDARRLRRLSAQRRLLRSLAEAPDPRRARLAAAAAPPDRAVRHRRRGRGARDHRPHPRIRRARSNIASPRSSSPRPRRPSRRRRPMPRA